MNKLLGVLFAIACFATAGLSGRMLGVGMWFWIIAGAGLVVAVSQFIPSLRGFATLTASVLAVIAAVAASLALFALVALGGSGPSNEDVLLIFGFAMISVLGFSIVKVNRERR